LLVRGLEDRIAPATFTVTNTGDTGTGSGNSGDLRYCIAQSNATTGPNTINFTGVTGTIVLNSPLPVITHSVTLTGPGPGLLSVQPAPGVGSYSPGFTAGTTSGSSAPVVNLSGLTVAGAASGVRVASGATTLTNVAVRSNSNGVTVSNGGSLTVLNSAINGNSSAGGIWVLSGASLLLQDSTVSGNTNSSYTAQYGPTPGGGVYARGALGPGGIVIRNCTISGNRADSGGGIGLISVTGTVLVQNCTVSGNTATSTNPPAGYGGGGVAVRSSTATTTLALQSTIVAGNTVSFNIARRDFGASTGTQVSIQADHCLIGTGDGVTLSSSTNNLIGTAAAPLDPLLAPLASAGGPTQTMAPYPGSTAIDHGSNPAGLMTDQTGAARVQGAAPDIGAVEHTPGPPLAVGAPMTDITQGPGGMTYQFTVTYYAETAINTNSLDGDDLLVTGPDGLSQFAQFVGVDDSANGTPRTATYKITIPAGPTPGASDGTYSLALQPNQVFDSSGLAVLAGPLGTFRTSTFVVTSLADSGPGTLRNIITQADTLTSSINTVLFDPSLFTSGAVLIPLWTALPTITTSMAIVGPGSGTLTVTRDPNTTASFPIVAVAAPVSRLVAISGLTVTGGNQSGLSLSGLVTLTDATVTNNSNTSNGGGIRASGQLTLHHCTVANNITGTNGGGGGIVFSGTLDVEDSDIASNSCGPGANGGGIYCAGGSLTVNQSTIRDNIGGFGGGLYVSGPAVIANSQIADNSCSLSVFGYSGGGGMAIRFGAAVTVQNSSITGNSAGLGLVAIYGFGNNLPALGGGIRVMAGATLTLVSSTVSGNTCEGGAPGVGGGIYFGSPSYLANPHPGGGVTIRDSTVADNVSPIGGGVGLGDVPSGTVLVQNSTVTGNTATGADLSPGYGGGGLGQYSVTPTSATVTLQNTVIAGNTAVNGRPDLAIDSAGVTVTADHCLLGAADTVTLTTGSANNLAGTVAVPLDPKLAPLADNGGPTQTCALLAGSPALNSGSNPAALTSDQRGTGFGRAVGTAPDIGAYEYKPINVVGVKVNDGSAQRSEVRSLTVTFSGLVSFAGGNAATAFQLQQVQTGDNVNLAAAVSTNGAGQTVVTLTFLPTTVNGVNDTDPVSGQNGGQLSLADGRYQLTVLGAAVSDSALGWHLDGDGDGVPGGDYQSPADTPGGGGLHLYRLFGDATGDGRVDLSDLAAFRGTYNAASGSASYLASLDADNSGAIDLTDLHEFGKRYNRSVF
jgi:hypothetical protein